MHRIFVLSLVACAGPDSAAHHSSPPPPAPAPAPVPAPTPTPAPPPPQLVQVFADSDPGYGFADANRKAKLAAAFPNIDKAIDEEMKQQNVPGLALGVIIDGELAYAKGYGVTDPAAKAAPDADTVYRIGSISKSFTALALLALRDDGTLHLDDPLTRWIPEASGLSYPTHDSPPITLRQLLTHTSGLPRDADRTKSASEAVFLAQLAKLPLENPPGRQFVYSNLGFGLLGIVAAHASHGSLQELMAKRVFGPLGMTSTFWHASEVPHGRLAPALLPDGKTLKPDEENIGVAAGAGGIYASVRDMARYVAFQLSAYPPRSEADHGLVHRATIREAHSTGVLQGGFVQPRGLAKKGEPAVEFGAASYGFGWAHEVSCNYDDIIEHNGAIESYRAAARFLTDHGVGFVVLTNFGNANTGAFAQRAQDALAATGALETYEMHGKVTPALDATMKSFLAVYNQWDEPAIKALLARPLDPREHDELAGYYKLHGACTAFELVEVKQGMARFKWTCERGAFEMGVNFVPDGRLGGFAGISRDVTAPPEVKTAANVVLSLIARWDDRLFARWFNVPQEARDALKKAGEVIRADAGSCKVKTYVREIVDWGFEAICEHGPDLRFDLPMEGGKIKSVRTHPVKPTTCPIK